MGEFGSGRARKFGREQRKVGCVRGPEPDGVAERHPAGKFGGWRESTEDEGMAGRVGAVLSLDSDGVWGQV